MEWGTHLNEIYECSVRILLIIAFIIIVNNDNQHKNDRDNSENRSQRYCLHLNETETRHKAHDNENGRKKIFFFYYPTKLKC